MNQNRSCLSVFFVFPLLMFSALSASAEGCLNDPIQSSKDDTANADELVRQAIANYIARESKAASYTWIEYRMTRRSFREGGMRSSDAFEIIPLAGTTYQRHFLHNDQPLPEHQEKMEQERLEAAVRKSMDTVVKLKPAERDTRGLGGTQASQTEIASDPQVAEIQASESAIRKSLDNRIKAADDDTAFLTFGTTFKKGLPDLQLPLEQLPTDFDFHFRKPEIVDGRETYVLDATPKAPGNSSNGDTETRNFQIIIWIDRADKELVKAEGKAIKEGVASAKPDYAVMDSKNYSDEADATEESSLYNGSLRYSRGTMITNEWMKINDEIWVAKRLQIKGKEVWVHPVTFENGKTILSSAAVPLIHERTYLRYRKFHVDTRILPSSR